MSGTRLLVIDIGNTNVSLGVFDYSSGASPAELAHHWRISTHREQTSDELGITLRALFHQEGLETDSVTDVIVSSVVPPLQPIWERVSTKLFDRPPLLVGPGIRTGMPVRYENPHEVGADRIVNAVAAYDIYRSAPSSRASTSRWTRCSHEPRSCIASSSRAPGP